MSPQDPARGPGHPPKGPLGTTGCSARVLGRSRSRRNDPKDFVCFCQGISRQEIVQCIESGAQTLEDIQNDLGATVGPCGGSCTPNVVKLLADTLARKGGAAPPAEACTPQPCCAPELQPAPVSPPVNGAAKPASCDEPADGKKEQAPG